MCTAAVMAAAIGALYVTAAPKFLSLLIEPISLLLLPGLVMGMAVAGKDDLSAGAVMVLSCGFYLAVFWVWFWRRGRAGGGSR